MRKGKKTIEESYNLTKKELRDNIVDYLVSAVELVDIFPQANELQGKVEGYNADYCSEDGSSDASGKLNDKWNDLLYAVADVYLENYEDFDESLKESTKLFIYQFPAEINDKYLKQSLDDTSCKVTFVGKVNEKGDQPGDILIKGTQEDLARFAEEYFDYELNPDYLYEEDEFDTDLIESMGLKEAPKKPKARFNANPQASADFIAKGTSFNQNLAGQPCCESDEEDDEEDEKKFDDEEEDIEIDGDIEVTDAPVEDEFNDGDITDLDFVDIDDFDDVDLDSISVDDIVDEDETALGILKDKIDMHGELSDDGKSEVITIAEKGKLDDKKAPKLTIEANEEETEILAKEFATDEEVEPTETTTDEVEDEIDDDDINFDEIEDGEKVDVKKELDNLKTVKVVGKEDTKEDTPVEDDVVEVEDDVDDTTLLDSLV